MPAHMESPTIYADTLRIAAETLGGVGKLALRLGVAPEELALWISGRQAAPLECFVTALDIIAERP
jgi:DNA-binding transcriptional regulator YdaS (Cro superfamily)